MTYASVYGNNNSVFQFKLPKDIIGSVAIVANILTFNAPKTLSQFNVISSTFNTTMDVSKLQVDIKLQRIISYHLTNTFMPTVTLLIIAEVFYQFAL